MDEWRGLTGKRLGEMKEDGVDEREKDSSKILREWEA